MAVNMQTSVPQRDHALHGASQLFASFARKTRIKAKAILKTVQMARMLSTLAHMSDNQLAHIGITRADIPEYAKKLLADE